MKATILVPFRDKHYHKVVYVPGEVKELDNDRVVALAARGLVKPFVEESQDAEVKVEADAKPAKGKGKRKSTKKEEVAIITSESEKVEADSNDDADTHKEADAENSIDNE